MPMHYETINQLTFAAFDPYSRQPSYKACAVNLMPAAEIGVGAGARNASHGPSHLADVCNIRGIKSGRGRQLPLPPRGHDRPGRHGRAHDADGTTGLRLAGTVP